MARSPFEPEPFGHPSIPPVDERRAGAADR